VAAKKGKIAKKKESLQRIMCAGGSWADRHESGPAANYFLTIKTP
jgi:hypothetical protein